MRFLTSFVNTHRRSLTMFVSIVTIAVLYNNFVDGNGNAPNLPVVVGHRGSCGIYPEHTEISYEKAAEMGSDYIECDVQITKVCKPPVIFLKDKILFFSMIKLHVQNYSLNY